MDLKISQSEVNAILLDVIRGTIHRDPKVVMSEIIAEMPDNVSKYQIRKGLKWLWEKQNDC